MNHPPSSGPATEEVAKTAANTAWMRPRSRGGMMSPTMAIASTMRPPPPSPCIPRARMSHVIEVASPQSAEPARNSPTDRNTIVRRP